MGKNRHKQRNKRQRTTGPPTVGTAPTILPPAGPSLEHVRPIASAQMSKEAEAQVAGAETGLWPKGKKVAEVFEILGIIGRGGMGVVYLAYDQANQRKIAVKVPLEGSMEDQSARKHIIREAEAWLTLYHPHIVHAFDVRYGADTGDRLAIFMDYCEGGSLADRLAHGHRPGLVEALDIARQICWAMEFAHGRGLIHRDLKPSNVLLTSDGRALVADFGLVKQLDASDSSRPDQSVGAEAPLVSAARGTPEYMPWEQWQGITSLKSDIYSFGVLLYELLCGQRPFTTENRRDLERFHKKKIAVNPRTLNREIPRKLARLIKMCLAKDPAKRGNFKRIEERLEQIYRRATAPGHRILRLLRAVGLRTPRQAPDPSYARARSKPTSQSISHAETKARAEALQRLAVGCEHRKEYAAAERQYRNSLKAFEDLKDTRGIALGLTGLVGVSCQLGTVLREGNDLDAALKLLQEAEALCRKHNQSSLLQACLGQKTVTLEALGHVNAALDSAQEQERLLQNPADRNRLEANLRMQLTLLGKIAEALQAQGNWENALNRLGEQEKLFCRLQDESGRRANLRNQMGVLGKHADQLGSVGDAKKALARLKEQELICGVLQARAEMQENLKNQVQVHGECADQLQGTGDWQGTGALLREQMRLLRDLGDQEGLRANLARQVWVLDSVVEALHKHNKQVEALDMLGEQEALLRELGDKKALSANLDRRALIFLDYGLTEDALALLQEQERLLREGGDEEGLRTNLRRQTTIFERQADSSLSRFDLEGALVALKRQAQLYQELSAQEKVQANLQRQARVFGLQVDSLCKHSDLPAALVAVRNQVKLYRELEAQKALRATLERQASILRRQIDALFWEHANPQGALAPLQEQAEIYRELGNEEALRATLEQRARILEQTLA